jgi:hypothetical protein
MPVVLPSISTLTKLMGRRLCREGQHVKPMPFVAHLLGHLNAASAARDATPRRSAFALRRSERADPNATRRTPPCYRGAHGKSRLGRVEPLLCQRELSWQALSMNQESLGFSRAECQATACGCAISRRGCLSARLQTTCASSRGARAYCTREMGGIGQAACIRYSLADP